ncbi:hypothetical protein L345_14467, partial [Ophiophagus hannah]
MPFLANPPELGCISRAGRKRRFKGSGLKADHTGVNLAPARFECKKKHTLVCPDFSKHGVCPKGSQCKLQHPQKKHLTKQAGTRGSCPPEQGNYAKRTWR